MHEGTVKEYVYYAIKHALCSYCKGDCTIKTLDILVDVSHLNRLSIM